MTSLYVHLLSLSQTHSNVSVSIIDAVIVYSVTFVVYRVIQRNFKASIVGSSFLFLEKMLYTLEEYVT